MPKSPPAVVTPAALRWARETVGYPIAEAARRLNIKPEKLESAEQGTGLLTMRQAEAAARIYHRPLAALFVPEPPIEEPIEAQFRRLPGAPELPWPPEMRLLSRAVRQRQDAAADVYDLLDETPPWLGHKLPYNDDTARLAPAVRELLGITIAEQQKWQDRSGYTALREWTDAVEALGVLVMQDGTLEVNHMRGFAAAHDNVPAIVVNTNDDPRARAFTVIHEFGHLLRLRAGVGTGRNTESWCDTFASDVLTPRDHYAADFKAHSSSSPLLDRIRAIALDYGITPMAAAVRASRLRLANEDDLAALIREMAEQSASSAPRGSGGDYYRTKIARLGPSYIRLVFEALDSQALSYPIASGLLNEKVNHLPTLREYLLARR